MSSSAKDIGTEKYLRIASLSIAAYDYIITLPAELRFYRSQSNIFRPSLGCVLFILIRYVSIIVMIVSNYGELSTSFTEEVCKHYYMIAPVFKVTQTMISQVILGVRAYNIARRKRTVGIGLVVAFFLTITLEWFTNMYSRVPVLVNGSCTPGNAGPPTAWAYYLVTMLWDLGTLATSTFYLVRYNSINGRFSRLIKTMIYDGLGYFVVLTAVNIFNLILYRNSSQAIQSSGASLGYAVTWIMSQKILIHLRELSEPAEQARFDNIIITRPTHQRSVTSALRSNFEMQKAPIDLEYGQMPPPRERELDVRVHVEQSVTVDYTGDEEPLRRGVGKTGS